MQPFGDGERSHEARPEDCLAGGGELGALMRSMDWSTTPLGHVASWPQSLRTSVSIMLASGFAIVVAWGPEFIFLYNDRYRPVLGASKHPMALGNRSADIFPEVWDMIGPLFRKALAGDTVALDDLLIPLDRNGYLEECFFTLSYSPIRDESGGVGGILAIVAETSERVQGERRLRTLRDLASIAPRAHTAEEACENAARAVSQNPADVPFVLLYLLGDDGQVRLVSRTGLEGESGSAAEQWPLSEASRTGRTVVVDELGGRFGALPGGAYLEPTHTGIVLPLTRPGLEHPYGFLVAGVSPRRALDDKYQGFFELAAEHVATAITNALSHEAERKRAEGLAEIDRAKTAFFSNVSHEFRTPLTLMLGPAEDALAAKDTLGPGDRERWSIVHRSALRLSKLVNTLLDFSRIEAGRVQASYEPTDLPALTGDLASMFRAAVDRAGLNLRLDLPPLDELAYVDREMWEKIVLNLLSNALKFTFDGEIAISLRVIAEHFELTVRDTGIGISAPELPHVFDRFHRVKGVRARTHEGTGIGLALVAELTKLHGGRASADSIEGHGTTFRIVVPRGRAHLPAERVGAERTLPSTATGAAPYLEEALRWMSASTEMADTYASPRARARIVLADDNADMRDYLARLLGERWSVEAVADGEAALRALRRTPANLVLSDVMMPELDGFGLLRAIRSDPALRLTPVVLLSARAGEEATAEGLTAGANDYIVKPFSARELLVRVSSQLASSEVAREARAIEEAARARLYGHFMQAPFPVAVLRGDNHEIELANSLALSAWGKETSIVGKPLIEGIPELRGQPFLGHLDEVLRTGVPYRARGELARLVRVEGGALEDAYFDYVYAPLRNAEDQVEGVLLSGFEVTAQVRASQELARLLSSAQASERQFRELVENLPELAWTARPDGHIDYYNRRWYEYTGTTFAQMEGWGWKSLHDPALLDTVIDRWTHSIETGEPFEMEFALRGADGVFRWFLTRVRPLRDADGRVVRWFGSNTNIDERRRNEDFREQFLGILGHDLRNPLNTILMTARALAMREDIPPEIRKKVERLATSGVRMQRMIEQLLDITRARLAGGIPIMRNPEPAPLGPIVAKIVDEIRAAHPHSVILLRTDGHCAARIDGDRFEQVVSNLLENAITHGDPSRTIDVLLTERNGGASMTVRNFGKPIDPAFLPLVFNPFARGERPHGRSAGLGLGLYVCERIIDAHGGVLSVQSTAEDGTRFEVTLPRQS